jgi:tetratricopeptide (TPR) repeat protein
MKLPVRSIGIALVSLGASFASADDELERRTADGKSIRLRGKIADEGTRKVVIQTADGDVSVPSHEVLFVRYDRQPAELITARGLLDAERYDEAAASFKTVYSLVKERDNEYLKAAVLFSWLKSAIFAARAGDGDFANAMKLAEDFRKQFSKSRHLHAFNELVGEMYLSMGDYDKAREAFGGLRDSDAPGSKEKAVVFEGLAMSLAGKANDAILNFDEVLQSTAESAAEHRLTAELFKADALLQGNPDAKRLAEAEKLLKKALSETPSANRLAKAVGHNALGDLLRKQKKPPKEALLQGYMYVVVLYDSDPRQAARATYGAYSIFAELGQRSRAEDMAKILRERYPNSAWTKKLPAAPAADQSAAP